jgi:Fe-only nitrogenase accessory protein AnfO
MEIAAYLDAENMPVSLYGNGALRLYDDGLPGGAWRAGAAISFRLDERMTLAQVKAAVVGAVRALGDCRVLLSGEVRGLPYSLLQEEHGFRAWRSEGELSRQLDYVRARETEAAVQKKYEIVLRASQPVPAPMPVRDGEAGHYWIDLRAALEHASNPTSRNILIPFLVAGRFGKLEVLCDHLPKWMAWEFERMDLAAETETLDATDSGLKVTVYSRQSPDGRGRPRGLAGAGTALCLPCPRDGARQQALPSPNLPRLGAWRRADIIDVETLCP